MNVLNKVTRKNLKKNKVRTIVTIIGVILSVSMITAVTTMISTLQNYLVESVIEEDGEWYATVSGVSEDAERQVRQDSRVERLGTMRTLGYAVLEGGKNADKPYWYVTAWDDAMFETVPVNLIQGRLPENGHEVVIPQHVAENGGVYYKIGDTLDIAVGRRDLDGDTLHQYNPLIYEEDTGKVTERLKDTQKQTYTIVGICERPNWYVEDYSAPGYTLITRPDSTSAACPADLYILTSQARDAQAIVQALPDSSYLTTQQHSELLQMMGIFGNENITSMIGAMAAILIAIIMVGSISLIYNAFAISVSERSREFGLLSSIGATRKQLKQTVLFEALFISVIGIPLGIVAGIGGIGVTIHFIGDWFKGIWGSDSLTMHLSVSIWAIVAAAVLGLLTILISAFIPSRRASRVTAIEAIRQSQDIQVRARQVKTSRITRKLFGFEGEMALKNLKRSRRRYRSTVMSLAISVVLFISASAFTMYAFGGSQQVIQSQNYDIEYSYQRVNYTVDSAVNDDTANRLFDQMASLESVTAASKQETINLLTVLDEDEAGQGYWTDREAQGWSMETGRLNLPVALLVMDEASFDRYLGELGLNAANYKGDALQAVAMRSTHTYNSATQRYQTSQIFKDDRLRTLSLSSSALWGDETEMTASANQLLSVRIGAFTDTPPMGISVNDDSGGLWLILPDTQIETIRTQIGKNSAERYQSDGTTITGYVRMLFTAPNSAKAAQDIQKILQSNQLTTDGLRDLNDDLDYERRFQGILQVFTYGFITLISLITVANVFNTISTNIHLRRREFAMLESVGMSPKGFKRMMRFECVFYGLKALLFGLPISLLITYAMYSSIMIGVDIGFMLPWTSIGISVLSVFLVVFITMLYATHKIHKENIIDALKTETT